MPSAGHGGFEALTFATSWLGRPREHWAALGSTNDRALAWARAGGPHGALVTADMQTAGRGRLGRQWSSGSCDDIYMSAILRPAAGLPIGALGLAVGVGLREGLARWLPGAQLKWPNDVLFEGRKLAGILCEARWIGDIPEVVAGLGINVGRIFSNSIHHNNNVIMNHESGNSLATATSLRQELGPSAPDRAEVLPEIILKVESALENYFRGGFAAIRGRYEPHCALRGRTVVIGGADRCQVLGLDDDGALLVRRAPGGPPQRVESGDVWLAPDPPACP